MTEISTLDNLPSTRAAAAVAGLPRYFTGKPCKHGHLSIRRTANGVCIACLAVSGKSKARVRIRTREDRAEESRRYYEKNKEAIKARVREARERDRPAYLEKQKEYYRTTARTRMLDRYQSSEEQRRNVINSTKNWQKANRDKYRAGKAKRRALVICARPSWVSSKEMTAIFSACPNGWHVDHIIPLRAKNVCGLDVPWNLRYLPAEINVKRSNKWSPDDPDDAIHAPFALDPFRRITTSASKTWSADEACAPASLKAQ